MQKCNGHKISIIHLLRERDRAGERADSLKNITSNIHMDMAKAKRQHIGRIDLSKMTIIDVDFGAHVRYDRALWMVCFSFSRVQAFGAQF